MSKKLKLLTQPQIKYVPDSSGLIFLIKQGFILELMNPSKKSKHAENPK